MKSTETKIDVYEVDGSDTKGIDRPQIKIKNHWNRRNLIVLEIEGKEYTVVASELNKGIENAQNIHPY